MKKHVMIITTGGTIAMKKDITGGLVPALSGHELIDAIPEIKEWADVEIIEFSNVPSGYMTVTNMAKLSQFIDKEAEKGNIDGFVVTHGTDTLEETAYFLDISLQTELPVCVTGAMRGADERGYDGEINLLDAIRVAADDASKERGVMVCLNHQIYAARSVTKTHTTQVDTFKDLTYGPLGTVYRNEIIYGRRPTKHKKVIVTNPEEEVWILSAWSGMTDASIMSAVGKAKGIVIEALGCGNVPPLCKKGLIQLMKKGIPVVLATGVPTGAVQEEYAYDGSLASMKKEGIISAGELSPKKARLLLAALLSKTKDIEEIRTYFAE